MLSEDVPRLMTMIPREEQTFMEQQNSSNAGVTSKAKTIFTDQEQTPFGIGSVEGINAGQGEQDWIVARSKSEYDQLFAQLSPQNGKISGASAKQEMIKSKLVRRGRRRDSFCFVTMKRFFLAEQCSRSYLEIE